MTDEECKKVKEEYSLLEAQVKEFFDKDMQGSGDGDGKSWYSIFPSLVGLVARLL